LVSVKPNSKADDNWDIPKVTENGYLEVFNFIIKQYIPIAKYFKITNIEENHHRCLYFTDVKHIS